MRARLAADEVLPPEAISAGRARRLLREVFAPLVREDRLEAALLAISEIVTNALVHAGTPMRLRILLAGAALRVELSDGSPRLPQHRGFGPAAATGRGLLLLEQIVTRWGAHALPSGKVVWFEIGDGGPGAEEPVPPAATTGQVLEVALLDMPLLMHLAWQEHGSALLRELMLVRLDTDLTALSDHASASDALAVLSEQVPVPEVGFEPQTVMANATEAVVTAAELVVEVSPESVASFAALDALLDEAVRLADAGELLAPPTQPEIEELRRWICAQVRHQAAGGPPTPWRSIPATAPPPRAPLSPDDWDPTEVTSSDRALIAADDANRIVAVSGPALTALGYVAPGELVGRRLLTIIPERYHQAHVAGFTLYLVNGRGPLLGRRVTVPVTRRDGGEVERQMLIRARSLPDGRHLFVAEISD